MDEEQHLDSQVIDALGGTAAVAKIFDIRGPSVSEWRRTGIPKARRQYLLVVHPEAFPADEGSTSTQQAQAA